MKFLWQCALLISRYGIRFDLFSDDDDLDGIDPITAKKINFLYNKAVAGKEYKEKPPAKGKQGPFSGVWLRDYPMPVPNKFYLRKIVFS